MKFVVLADKSYNFKKPLAEGLKKTLNENGHECVIFYDALYWLYDLNLIKLFAIGVYHLILNIIKHNSKLYQYRFLDVITFFSRERKKMLRECDCIVCVENCPCSFRKRERLDFLRDEFKKPIVSYDFHYLPNQGWWKYMQDGKYKGLEQFDWYLPVGLVTEFAIPKDIPQMYDCVGMDLRSDDLYPEQTEFTVLLDFPRPGHEETRRREKDLLNSAGIKFIELKGRYTTSEIRAIYRRVSAYFVSCRESFGLPIIEMQLCGAKIFIPHVEWVPAHFLNKNPFCSGVGELGQNFIVYNNDTELVSKLKSLSETFDPQRNIEAFKSDYPDYYKININNLNSFINKLSEKKINSLSHVSYIKYNSLISKIDDYKSSDLL